MGRVELDESAQEILGEVEEGFFVELTVFGFFESSDQFWCGELLELVFELEADLVDAAFKVVSLELLGDLRPGGKLASEGGFSRAAVCGVVSGLCGREMFGDVEVFFLKV